MPKKSEEPKELITSIRGPEEVKRLTNKEEK